MNRPIMKFGGDRDVEGKLIDSTELARQLDLGTKAQAKNQEDEYQRQLHESYKFLSERLQSNDGNIAGTKMSAVTGKAIPSEEVMMARIMAASEGDSAAKRIKAAQLAAAREERVSEAMRAKQPHGQTEEEFMNEVDSFGSRYRKILASVE